MAWIWAASTAARDGLERPAPWQAARSRIDEAISGADYVLVVAGDRQPVAFGLAVLDGRQATVMLVGVDPAYQRRGLGAMVMTGLAKRLRDRGVTSAELDVYADNVGAIALYEGLGWERGPGADTPHSRTGKPQRHYRLALGAPGGTTAATRGSSETPS